MTRHLTIAITLALLFGAAAHAQPQLPASPLPASPQSSPSTQDRYVDPAGGLSLEAAIALALKQEPSLRAARTTVDAALARRQQAALRANPTATVERREEPGGTDNQTMLGVQLSLELFRRGARVSVAESEVAVSRFEVADRERRLTADVRARYGDVLIAIRELSVVDELISAARQQLDIVGARVKEGAAPPLERDLLDVEVRRLRSDRRLQIGRVDSRLVELRRAVGLSPDAPLTVTEMLEAVVGREAAVPANRFPETHDVVRNHVHVRTAEARVAAADARIRQSQSEGRFDVSLFGTYMRMDAGFPQRAFGSGGSLEPIRGVFNYVAGGAMVMIPVFNRNQGAVAAARAERAGADAEREAAVLHAHADLMSARIEDAAAHEAAAQYRDGARRLAQQNVKVVAETFQLGRLTVFEVLSEQRRYLDVEKSFTDALRSAFEARTRLLLALGDVR